MCSKIQHSSKCYKIFFYLFESFLIEILYFFSLCLADPSTVISAYTTLKFCDRKGSVLSCHEQKKRSDLAFLVQILLHFKIKTSGTTKI